LLSLCLWCAAALGPQDIGADDRTDVPTAIRTEHPFVHRVALDRNGAILASAHFESISLHNAVTGDACGQFSHDAPAFYQSSVVTDLKFTNESETLVSAGRDGTLRFWSVQTGRITRIIREPWIIESGARHTDGTLVMHPDRTFVPMESLALSADGRVIAAGTLDGTAQIWDAKTGRHLGECGEAVSKRRTASLDMLAPDRTGREEAGNRLAKTAEDGTGLIPANQCELWQVPDGSDFTVRFVGLNATGTVLVLRRASTLLCYDVRTRRPWISIASCGAAAISADRDMLLCFEREHSRLITVNLVTRQRGKEFNVVLPGGRVSDILLCPNRQHAIALCSDRAARVVELASGDVLATYALDGKTPVVDSWSLSGDGARLAIHWRHSGTHIWNVPFAARGP
jgi:WD40 repeat protein